jgi:hypothetical protein
MSTNIWVLNKTVLCYFTNSTKAMRNLSTVFYNKRFMQ